MALGSHQKAGAGPGWGLRATQAFFRSRRGDLEESGRAAEVELTSLGSVPRCFGRSTMLGFGRTQHLVQPARSWDWESSVLAARIGEGWILGIKVAFTGNNPRGCTYQLAHNHTHKSFGERKI